MPFSKMDCVMTTPEKGMVIAVATFTVRGDRLYQALTDPAEIDRWWGGWRGGSFVTWSGKAEVGGEWQAEGAFSRGRTFSAKGAFLEIEPGNRFVQTWHSSWDDMVATQASLRFEAVAEGTTLSLVHMGFQGREAALQAQAQIWWRVIKWLRPYLQGETDRQTALDLARDAGL